jgi:hypothetical protein
MVMGTINVAKRKIMEQIVEGKYPDFLSQQLSSLRANTF